MQKSCRSDRFCLRLSRVKSQEADLERNLKCKKSISLFFPGKVFLLSLDERVVSLGRFYDFLEMDWY